MNRLYAVEKFSYSKNYPKAKVLLYRNIKIAQFHNLIIKISNKAVVSVTINFVILITQARAAWASKRAAIERSIVDRQLQVAGNFAAKQHEWPRLDCRLSCAKRSTGLAKFSSTMPTDGGGETPIDDTKQREELVRRRLSAGSVERRMRDRELEGPSIYIDAMREVLARKLRRRAKETQIRQVLRTIQTRVTYPDFASHRETFYSTFVASH